jgi:hypothetical protein
MIRNFKGNYPLWDSNKFLSPLLEIRCDSQKVIHGNNTPHVLHTMDQTEFTPDLETGWISLLLDPDRPVLQAVTATFKDQGLIQSRP